MTRTACVAVVKNEARHIAEWLAYQFALGFDTVLLLDNMSTDATKANAMALAKTRDVQILDWPLTAANYQIRGYQFAVSHLDKGYDWLAFFDTDEFLVLDPGVTLQSCLEARADAAALAIPWAMFGASGHRTIPPGLIIENFVYRGPPSFGPNRHVKSIIRPETLTAIRNVHNFAVDGRTTDLAGRDIAWMIDGVQANDPDYCLGKLHHYFTRSWQHWSEKLARGYPDTKRATNDFNQYDLNDIFDDSACSLAPAIRAILAETQ